MTGQPEAAASGLAKPAKAGLALLVLLVLFALLSPTILNALNGSATYRGVVVDSRTGKPVPNAEVRGSYMLYGWFVPGPGGLYTVTYPSKVVRTDAGGCFTIELRGTARTLMVVGEDRGGYYRPFECDPDKRQQRGKIAVELTPW